MSIKNLSVIVALLLITSTLLSGITLLYFEEERMDGDDTSSSVAMTGSGNGIDEISTLDDLDDIRYDLSGHYVLVNDIDASDTEFWNDGKGWVPIGTADDPFTGTLDGDGFEIYNLFIDEAPHMITIGSTGWDCAIASSNVLKIVLEDLGFLVDLEVQNMGSISNDMVDGHIDFTTGFYMPTTHDSFWTEYSDYLQRLNVSTYDTKIGFVVPDYTATEISGNGEASISDLKGNEHLFSNEIIGISEGAGIMDLSLNAINDYDLDIDLFYTSETDMLNHLQSAVSNGDHIVVPLWSPHWIFAELEGLVFLEDPEGIFFDSEDIWTVANKQWSKDEVNEDAVNILTRFQWDIEDLNRVIFHQLEMGEVEGAQRWVDENSAKVSEWTEGIDTVFHEHYGLLGEISEDSVIENLLVTYIYDSGSTPQLNAYAGYDIDIDAGDIAYFDGSGSSGDIVEWRWSFNDGEDDVILYGETQFYQFLNPGDFYVELRVEDNDGAHAYDGLWVYVYLEDDTPPEIIFYNPTDGAEVTLPFVILVDAIDELDEDVSKEYRLDDGEWIAADSLIVLVIHDMELGQHTLDVRAADSSGNVNESSITFTVIEERVIDPVEIRNLTQLDAIRNDLAGDYILMADIDASETVSWNDGLGFSPIGNISFHMSPFDLSNTFTGTFDGNGHSISGLHMVYEHEEDVMGLFGAIGPGGLVKDLTIIDAYVEAYVGDQEDGIVGSLVGMNTGGSIINCHVSSEVIGNIGGGLVGYNMGSIESSSSSGIVDVVMYAGGLVGLNLGLIYDSNAACEVSGNDYVGGLVGVNGGDISESSAVGVVSGGLFVGGLVGMNSGDIIGSDATGHVNGEIGVGGLVGVNIGGIIGSDANCDVNGEMEAGGLVGINHGNISDSQATGDVIGELVLGGLVGLNYGDIKRSSAGGDVSGGLFGGEWVAFMGGLVGLNIGSISDSHATGDVSGEEYIGGLVGSNAGMDDVGSIINSYSVGSVNGDQSVGGLVGNNHDIISGVHEGVVSSSFWDIDTSGQTSSAGGEGKNTIDMMSQSTFATAGWDFVNVWMIYEGSAYPVHISADPVDDDEPPIARAGPDQTVDAGTTVTFDGSASTDNVGIVDYTWTFSYGDDTITLNGISPSFKFDIPGSYEVTLTVKDAADNSDTDSLFITVNEIHVLVADAGEDITVEAGDTVTLDGSNSSHAVSWNWHFTHDSQTHNLMGETVEFTFTVVGVYEVTLMVTDANGNEASDNITVTVNEVPDREPPIANAGVNRTVDLNALVTFDGRKSTDNVGIVSYHWTISDEDGVVLHTTTSSWFSYRFTTGGAHTVILTVADAAGNSDSATVTLFVDDLDTTDPRARAGSDVNIGLGGLVVFDGFASWDDVGIVNYSWKFHYDGQDYELFGVSPVFRFAAVGSYEVTLTVRDAADNWDQDTMTVTVEGDTVPPIARAGPDRIVDEGDWVVLDGSRSWDNVAVTGYVWIFDYDGDEKVLEGVMNIHRFNIPGVYTVTLNVTDAAGNSDTDTMTVTVEAAVDTIPPIARAGPDRTVDEGDWVVFDGSRSWDNVAVTGYVWTFDYDGEEKMLEGVMNMHRFSIPGVYTVTLNVTDAAGNWNQDTMTVTVDASGDTTPPIADISINMTGNIAVFDGIASWDDVGIVNYTWNISSGGDVITLYGEAVFHVFGEPGVYEVTLTVRDEAGNEGSETVNLGIPPGSLTASKLGTLTASALVQENVNKGTVQVLDGSSSTGASSYTWTIKHGGDVVETLHGEVTIYRFNLTGEYTVTLNVSDNGEFDEDVVTVTVHPEDNIPPISRPGSDGEVDVGTAVAFDGSRSWDNVAVTAYNWTILLDDEVVHVHDGVTFTYRFDVDGIYTVALNVSDAAGNYHNRSLTMTVNPDDNVNPVAVMAPLPDVDMGALVVLDGSASYDNVAVTGYEWTITKDHVVVATLNGETTSYRFNVPGDYTVTLNVTDDAGNWNVTERSFTVHEVDGEDPVAVPQASTHEADVNAVVSFDGSASHDNVAVTGYEWTISGVGDDVILEGMTVAHRFTAPGDYTVTLNVTDDAGNWNETSLQVTVSALDTTPPIADAGDDAEIRQDEVFVFDGSRSWDNVAVTNYTWTFNYDGDIVTLYGETPSFEFAETGVYVVTLIAKDAEDNQDEDTVTITVLENWAPTIESDAPTGPVGDDEFIVGWSIVHAMEANETVTWSFSTNASFIQYSAANGTFWGTPDEVGSYHVTVTATSVDGTLEAQVTYHINVTARVLVTGTVMDSSDLAVAGATISVDGVEVAVSCQYGNYSFLIEPGTYTLQATKEGHSFKSSTLTATTGSVAVTEITEDLAEDDDDDMTMYIGAAAAVVVILALLLVIKRRF